MTSRLRVRLRGLGKWLLRVLLWGIALLALALLAVGVGLSTAPGRRIAAGWLVAAANRALPGHVELERIDTLNPYELALSGLSLRAPAGERVLAVGRARLEFEPWRLLFHGQIIVPVLELHDVWLDVRAPADPAHGISAALSRKPSSQPEASRERRSFRIEALSVRGLGARLPRLGPLGEIDLAALEVDAELALGTRTTIGVHRLRGELRRGQSRLGEVSLEALLDDRGGTSTLRLRSAIADCGVELNAEGTYRRGDDFWQTPLDVSLQVGPVTAQSLRAMLGTPALVAPMPAVRASLQATGSPGDLRAAGSLESGGASAKILALIRSPRDAGGRPAPAADAQVTLDANVDVGALLPIARAFGAELPELSGRIDAQLSLHRRSSGTVTGQALLRGSGSHGRSPWHLRMEPADISSAGLHIPRLTLSFAGQRVNVEGRYSDDASELELELESPDLSRLVEPLGLPEGLSGSAHARVVARGFEERPRITIAARGRRVRWGKGPELDGVLHGTLDALQGRAELDGRIHERRSEEKERQFELSFRASSDFGRTAAWLEAWRRGEHDFGLRLEHLSDELASELMGRTLPIGFELRGELSVRTRHGAPVVRWQSSADVGTRERQTADADEGTGRQALRRLTHVIEYANGQLRTELDVSDARGPWLSLGAELGWPAEKPGEPSAAWLERVPVILDDLPALLERASWRIHFEAAPRAADELPFLAASSIGAAVATARAEVHKQPGAEPRGTLDVELQDLRFGSTRGACSVRGLQARAHVVAESERVRVELSVHDAAESLARAVATADLDVSGLLRGQPPRLGELDLEMHSQRLSLAALPFGCDRLRGVVSAQATVQGLLGAAPRGSVRLEIDGFSLGSDETVDVTASIEADANTVSVDSRLVAGNKTSLLTARFPVARAVEGSSAGAQTLEARMKLDALPIAPFASPGGAISYASGSLSGTVIASGNLAAPELQGRIKLNRVGFTLTSIAQPLTDIHGELSFQRERLEIRRLSARDGDGRLSLDGSLVLDGTRSVEGALELVARSFPLRQAGRVVATSSAKARARISLQATKQSLRIQVLEFATQLEGGKMKKGLSLDPHPDVVVDGAPADGTVPANATRAPEQGLWRGTLQLNLDADERFWIRRTDFALALRAALQLVVRRSAVAGRQPDLSVAGRVAVDRGYIELLGKTFDIEPGGSLRFSGTPIPVVDLTAIYTDRRSGKKVHVNLSSSAAAPSIEFSIDGAQVSAGEAMQAIYAGPTRVEGDTRTDAETEATQLLGAVTAGLLTSTLRQRLGGVAPIVSVAPADEETPAQIRAGFELDAVIPAFMRHIVTGMYVEGSVSADQTSEGTVQEAQHEVLVELYFPHDLVVTGRHGGGTTWSLDFSWRPWSS